MTDKERVINAINKIDDILTLDFITAPVREELTNVKVLLVLVRDNL
jgi:hypothetical protein|tara:strand:- start:150 stop:287 length:138 start_codon:yes stop_codon:yes gene_type:complete